MSTFPLRVGTPDGLLYEGDVARVVCRTISGDRGNFCRGTAITALHLVWARRILCWRTEREEMPPASAECFHDEWVCRVLATTWEWEEDIDAERAEAAKHRAEQALANGGLTDKEYRIAEAKLQRALVRLSVKNKKTKAFDEFRKSYRRRLF